MKALTAPVITADTARKITNGREPLLPAEYEEALRALDSCTQIDEAKYWNTKADIFAAWAKIYHSEEILRKARIIKLHAYRRMSQIAEEIRPLKAAKSGVGGQMPGPNSFLHEQGFTKPQAREIRAVGRAPQPLFDKAVNARIPPTPSWFRRVEQNGGDPGKSFLMTVYTFRDFCRATDPEELAAMCANKTLLRSSAIEIQEWADRLEQVCDK